MNITRYYKHIAYSTLLNIFYNGRKYDIINLESLDSRIAFIDILKRNRLSYIT
nr:MAG TPA: hypothetical protein [Bacteriophage sp.]